MKKYLFLVGLFCVIMMFVSANLGDKIINEPLWLILSVFLITVTISYKPVFSFFKPKEATANQESSNKFLIGIMWISIATVITFSLLAPVRFAIVMASKKNEARLVACEIKSFHKRKSNKRKKLWYVFDGHTNKKKLTISDYRKLLEGRNNKNYKIYLTVKKSILNTHVIQRYEIKE